MNKKGFTLIELIAVVVIMGMIILIVAPATSRLVRSNENKKYDTYYDAVQAQLELYARTRRDELGGIDGSGCVEDKKLSELRSYDYIKEYTDDKNITCLSPGDFTDDRLEVLGIDTEKDYINVRINNKNGKISVQFSMICVSNYDDPDYMSVEYTNLYEKEDNCENYVPIVTNSLLNAVKNNSYTVQNAGSISYIKGNPTNNYVWYSGKMWRIVSYDTTNRTIKLVTDDVVSIVNYDNKADVNGKFNNNYSSSNIFLWLKNIFQSSLRNVDKYLLDAEWNYSEVSANPTDPITSGSTVVSKVGMLNTYEYNNSSDFLKNGKNFWLLSTNVGDNHNSAWYVNESGSVTSSVVSKHYGIRPSIVLKPNVTYVNGGDGTFANPYKLNGDISANIGTKLNTRFPGEYVSFNNILFRISSVDARYTKLVSVNTISLDSSILTSADYVSRTHITTDDYSVGASTIKFHFFDKQYSDNTFIGEYLKDWKAPISEKLAPDGGDFCRMTMTETTSQTISCPPEFVLKSQVALPQIGDMYAVGTNDNYWTINNSEATKMNVILKECAVTTTNIDTEATPPTVGMYSILPVIVIDNTVTIGGGNGTSSSPYTLQ